MSVGQFLSPVIWTLAANQACITYSVLASDILCWQHILCWQAMLCLRPAGSLALGFLGVVATMQGVHDKVSEHVNILSDGSLGYKELISCDDGHEPLQLTPSLPNSVLAAGAVSHQDPGATGVLSRQAYAEQSQVGGIIIKAGKAPSLST